MSTKLGKQIYNVIIVYPPELFEFYIYLNTMNWQYQLMFLFQNYNCFSFWNNIQSKVMK